MIGDGVVVSPQRGLRITPVVVGFSVVRFQADCLVLIGDGGLVLPPLSIAPVVVGLPSPVSGGLPRRCCRLRRLL